MKSNVDKDRRSFFHGRTLITKDRTICKAIISENPPRGHRFHKKDRSQSLPFIREGSKKDMESHMRFKFE